MQIIGLILVLINVGTIVAPIAGMAIVYQDHIESLVIPPELTQILNSTVAVGQESTTLAKIVGVEFDNASRTMALTVNFTNPLNYTLSLKSFAADVECTLHNYQLGHLELGNAFDLPAAETTQAIINCTWTQSGESHFQTEHPGATSIDLNLAGLTVNVNDITMQMSEPIGIPNVPIV
jgi:hypothetical protein